MGRGLNCGEGYRKPRTLTVVSWVPSRRRLTGHKEERQHPQCRLPHMASLQAQGRPWP